MSYDDLLADRVRHAVIQAAPAHGSVWSEKQMFGGLVFLVGGKMACGVLGSELMVRVGPERYDEALRHPHVRPMDFTGRPMRGYVFVYAVNCQDQAAFQTWAGQAVSFVIRL